MIKRDFNFGLAANGIEPSRDDFGIIEDQDIAFFKQVRKFSKNTVVNQIIFRDIQQFAAVTRISGLGGNQAAV